LPNPIRRRRGALLASLAAAAVGATLAFAPSALATFPGDNGTIAFSRDGDIWTVSPDGTGEKRLTTGAEHVDTSPEWSPDGQWILFNRQGTQGLHMYRMKSDGSAVTWIGPGHQPVFSRDGKRIAYGDGDQVVVANLDGSGARTITDDDWFRYARDWSPVNDLILWEIQDNTDWIGATAPNGGELSIGGGREDTEELSGRDDAISLQDPEWSPDGTRIAATFSLASPHPCWDEPPALPQCPNPDPEVGINVIDLSGNRTLIRPGHGSTPAWSPDGTRIAFAEGGQLKVMAADGSGVHPLVAGAQPDWQPLAKGPPPPPEPEIRTVTVPGPTVTVHAPPPPPIVITETIIRTAKGETITRTVGGQVERCVIPAAKRKLTLTIRATKAIKKGATVKVTVNLNGAKAKVKVPRGKPFRAVVHSQ
jgi:dipeptidyl aminopeptidase/acylaminoacyl peptidase